jgi:hypothetical protein
MSLTLQPVRVGTGSDEEGMLVFDDDQRLVAVLTHLSDQCGDVSGHWYLEAKFGLLEGLDPPISGHRVRSPFPSCALRYHTLLTPALPA